jgi:hypothetical protein
MASEYRLQIAGRDGILRAIVVDMLDLAYTRQVNAAGIAVFRLPPDHPAIAALELDGQVEVWRRDADNGIPWAWDARLLYRGSTYHMDENNDETFAATCVGQLHFLSRRVVAYPANHTGTTVLRSLPAETIMRTLVDTNCTANATVANGRLRAGTLTGISVEPDQARGTVVSWSGPGKVILSELQDLALRNVGNGDFDLVKTGPATWTFRFYPGQLGTDRSSGPQAVIFDTTFDNMGEPTIVLNRVEEKTYAIVGGQGEEAARRFIVRSGPDASATNDIETFVDARNTQSAVGLATSGDRALDGARARAVLTFQPLQTPGTRYGKHYFLGDLVLARYRDLSVVQKVAAVTITLTSDGDEQVSVELKDL